MIGNWAGIIASNHNAIASNYKITPNRNCEIESFIKYNAAVKICNDNEEKIIKEEYLAPRWPIQQEFETKVSEK
jgi:hypothetical protein